MQPFFLFLFLTFFSLTNLFAQQPTPPSEPFELLTLETISPKLFERRGWAVVAPLEIPTASRQGSRPQANLVTPPRPQMPINLSLIINDSQRPIVIIDYSNEKELFLEENINENLKAIRQEILCARERCCWVVLNLSGDDLYRIPETFFEGLINIVWLDLSHNNFIGLPAINEHLPYLQVLDLSYNFFSQAIFCTLGWCETLHTINLSHNQIEIIFHYTRFPPSLRNLDISHNQEDTPDKILYLPNYLKKSTIEIHAEGNRIQFI